MSEHKTAKKIRRLSGFTGEAWLYRLSPAYVDKRWNGEETQVEHVISSAASVMLSGAETYLFPATADGEVVSWLEMDGSFRGALDCDRAVRNLGYEVEG